MRILLAIEDSACSNAAAQAVIDRSKPEGADVLVLHVVEWPKSLSAEIPFADAANAARQVVTVRDECRRRGTQLVEETVARLRAAGFIARGDMREGDARAVILDVEAAWQPDVIVLGSHGRRGVDRWLLGSVSEAVARQATCSVDIVRQTSARRVNRSA